MKGWNQHIQEENVERHKALNLMAMLVRSVFKTTKASERFQKAKAKLIHNLIIQQVREKDFWARWNRSPKYDQLEIAKTQFNFRDSNFLPQMQSGIPKASSLLQ